MADTLGVFTQPGAEVESQCDQLRNLTGFGVGDDDRCGHDGMDNTKGGILFSFDQRVLYAVCFKLTNYMSVQSCVGLGIWGISWVG